MSFTPSFTAIQVTGEPSQIVITDTSSGSDVAIDSRRVYLRKSDGTFLVPTGTTTEYIEWNYADTTITIDALDQDYALYVIVQWLTSGGSILYASSILSGFTLYNEEFDYSLTQRLSGNPALINDNGFFSEKSELRTNIDSGNQAIDLAADQYGAQQCYNIATGIRLNSQYYFNVNS